MDPLLSFISQPWMVAIIAVAVFTGRVVILAKRLKSASSRVTLADMRALEEAKKALDSHKKSLEVARATLQDNLGASRDTLRHYKGSFSDSVDVRKRNLGAAMQSLDGFKEPLEKAQADQKSAYKSGLKNAKRLYKDSLPRKPRRSREDAPKDI